MTRFFRLTLVARAAIALLLFACSGSPGVGLLNAVPDAGGEVDSGAASSGDATVDATPDGGAADGALDAGGDVRLDGSLDAAPIDAGPVGDAGDAGCDAGDTCAGKCGQLVDGCGRKVNCGGCEAGTCGGGGTANVCGSGTCSPTCAGKACGASDGCSGVCAQGSCPSGEKCVAGTCTCDPGTCAGCCEGTACEPGTATAACGHGGGVCQSCTGEGQTCGGSGHAGVCGCTPHCTGCGGDDGCGGTCNTCSSGQTCVGGACVCNATSCPNGCCEGSSCLTGTSTSACRSGGALCGTCSSGLECAGGNCLNATNVWNGSTGWSTNTQITVDPGDTYVYFIDQNNSTTDCIVWRVPTAGGAPQIVAGGLRWPVNIVVDSSQEVYWQNVLDDVIMTCSASACSPRVLATGVNYPSAMALSNATLYWDACDSTGMVCNTWQMPTAGGTPSPLNYTSYSLAAAWLCTST